MSGKQPWSKKDIPNLNGKLAIVTGATGGLGFDTAVGLAEAGATVILAGRNDDKGKDALNKILALVPQAKISFEKVDLGSLESIKQFSARINARNEAVDILVNNAGIMTPPKRLTTSDGFEIQFGTNHLSHFALTAQILPALRKSSSPRVVNVSSLAHRQGKINFSDLQAEKSYSPTETYHQSKLANLLFSFELQRLSEELGWGLTVVSAHPGISKTDLVDNGPGSGGVRGRLIKCFVSFVAQDSARGAEPQLYAATSPDAKAGGYYGPNGFYEIKGAVAPAYSIPAASDPETAKKLWDVSIKLTGVTWP